MYQPYDLFLISYYDSPLQVIKVTGPLPQVGATIEYKGSWYNVQMVIHHIDEQDGGYCIKKPIEVRAKATR